MGAAMMSASALPRRDLALGVWLLAIAALVAAMIVVGGATRLTDSGLSITEWNLSKGLTPPLGAERWAEEFARYRQTTEYQMQNNGMSLAEFQAIYWWEWSHRFLGKMIGVAFALPFGFFWATGRLRGRFWPLLALFALGGLQGAIGWWMVMSGLWSGLDVNPVRLAIHLAMALILLAGALWLGCDALGWPAASGRSGAPPWMLYSLPALVFAQALLGALMAGANGGAAFADWPTIGGAWWPASAFSLEPFWRNFTEEPATQQLLHRSLGYTVALAALLLAGLAWRTGEGLARALALRLGVLALIQAGLGVATLINGPGLWWWGLAHQFCAVALWSLAILLARNRGV
jgi:heme a synthase